VESLRKDILKSLDDAEACQSVIADLAKSQQVDSKGLNLLLAIYRETQHRKIGFRVENSSEDVRRIMTLLNLNERFGIKATA
jgi:anti-anti-sigma factor